MTDTLGLRFLDVHLCDGGAVLFGWVIWFDSFLYPSPFLFIYLLFLINSLCGVHPIVLLLMLLTLLLFHEYIADSVSYGVM